MAVIIVTAPPQPSTAGQQPYRLEGRCRCRTASIAAWFGSDLMRTLSNQTLTRIFVCLLVVFGARMLWKGDKRNA
jgi:hypothetical protein